MGKRIALINCISPRHTDSTPSMAVYDQGQDKLQVFCFGCGYHAWVYPTEIDLTNPQEDRPRSTVLPTSEPADHKQLVTQFFLDRNFKENKIPWGSIRMGNEVRPVSNYPESRSISVYKRPYMEWDLLDKYWIVRGIQRRYLDDGKPMQPNKVGACQRKLSKTKYIPVNGEYADVAWTFITKRWYDALHITESWIDAHWVKQHQVGDVMTILGTNPDKIKDKIYQWSKEYETIHLWFDGDSPGIRCAEQILFWCIFQRGECVNHTKEGKKVYEL